MEEKSGVTPIFETIMPGLRGLTSLRTMFSTVRFRREVISEARAGGRLTLITNWPASVRGKNATPEQRDRRPGSGKDDQRDSGEHRQRAVSARSTAQRIAVEHPFEAGG